MKPSAQDAAATWYARTQGAQMTAAEQAALDAWIRADAEHATAWDRVGRLNALLGQVSEDPAIMALRREARGAAVAAVPAADAGRRRWPLAVGLAAALAAAVGLPLAIRGVEAPPSAVAVAAARQQYSAGASARTIALADGSTLYLDARSAATVALGPVRAVTLNEGRAVFTVAKDKARPFVVSARGNKVTALGTQFGVELGRRDTMVALIEGSVRVETPAGTRTLRPGETLRAGNGTVAVRTSAEESVAWRTGRLDFTAVPLGEVADALNRYATRRIVIADAALARQPYSGSFTAQGGADALVTGLTATGVARVVSRTDQSVTLAR
ncbi:FecR family protein [Sphingomonas sp. IC4-52]|uniref:FecR family protein n=1 Tax=Sphingomonas sp. IC4-52 TaxID=2887202 RepID=UPI001D10EC66|nr:FecR domain-containing protein [Sphingomonas sp. IC4-52]MCC2981008.1 FecR domain-containing protein [Sphingomonas sp. IC4-52]